MGRIYPQELKLNQENQNDDKATFLDLEEQIIDACIEVKTYDKRDAFKFEIIKYHDLSGNVPTKPAYGVFISQVISYSRICRMIWSKCLRASSKNYYGNTTPSMASSHFWRNVWRNITGSRPNLAQGFTGTSQKNNDQHSRNFGPSPLLLVTPAGNTYYSSKQMHNWMKWLQLLQGLTLHSCYCN